ncbi:MAG: hypothetical protein P9L94_19795 [Candidatus Hinthialibacter antarcticus]|nr:hypothetical protein [Candidatus Hinthialibacter antarcticus]
MPKQPFDDLKLLSERRLSPPFSEESKGVVFDAARRRVARPGASKRGLLWKALAAAACLAIALFWMNEAKTPGTEPITFPAQPLGVAKRDVNVEADLWKVTSIEFPEVDGVSYGVPVITYEITNG